MGKVPLNFAATALSLIHIYLTATLDYAYGGVLDLSRPDVQLQDARQWIRADRRQACLLYTSRCV